MKKRKESRRKGEERTEGKEGGTKRGRKGGSRELKNSEVQVNPCQIQRMIGPVEWERVPKSRTLKYL